MKKIDSLNNSKIKFLVCLHEAKERKINNSFLVEGLRACQTFLNSGLALQQIYVIEEQLINAQKICDIEQITLVTKTIMKKISQAHTPSGILAQFELPIPPDPNTLGAGLVLAQIQDPGNMGTLIRTAAALNVNSIVIVEGADYWSHKVIQASAGTIANIRLFKLSWEQLLFYKKNLKLVALVLDSNNSINYIKSEDSLIVVGNEAQGIPLDWQHQCDQQVSIPMPGNNVESLNAAVAGSIALYSAYNLCCKNVKN